MSIKFRHSAQALLPLATVLLAASPCFAGWESNVSYGGTLKMDLYTPSKLASPPPVVVAIHFCTGNSGSTHSWFQASADKYGFYIISPDAGKQCFDASPTRDGDKAAVVKMVDYIVQKGADKSRVFVAGASSGGCMTNTLIAIYPDVFAGGAAAPGFPAGGWPAGDTSCTKCGSQPPTKSAKEWGDIARNAFSWTGARPKSQQWVGENDEYNFDGYLPSVVAQFTDLMGLDAGASATGPSGWVRKEYKDSSGTVMLQTNIGTGMPHDLTSKVPWTDVVSFFGLDKASAGGGGSGSGGASSGGGGKGPVAAAGRGNANTGGSVSGGGRGNVPGGAPGAGGSAVAAGGKANPPGNGGAPSAGGAAAGGVKPTDTATVPPKGSGGASSSSKTSATPSSTGGSQSASGGSNAVDNGKGGSMASSTTSTTDNKSTGGSANGSGGSSSTTKNGTSQPDATGNQTTPPDSGGGCAVVSHQQTLGGLFGLLLAGVALLARRRQRIVE